VLAQVWNQEDHDTYLSNWKDSEELELTWELSTEWLQFRRALQAAGVIVTGNEDELIWTGGDTSGVISVKNVYEALISTQNLPLITSWRIQMWKWNIPQKIKLFLWLAVNNKISTWKNLQHRGWIGQERCHLCKKEEEDCSHLFIFCSFTTAVWTNIKRNTKIDHRWNGNNLGDCIANWSEAKLGSPSLAAYTCWNNWLERNVATFEGKEPSISSVVIKSLSNYHKPTIKHKNPRTRPFLNADISEYPVAFFDGATQADGRCCSAGGIIKLSESTTFKWFVNCGAGTNTKAELMGAWATLHIEKYLSIQKLQVLGDSSVIINWLNKKGNLMVSALEGWKQRIIILKGKFIETNFYHIFRNFNMEMDGQSKRALSEPKGYIVLHKWSDGMEGTRNVINIY
jgi:ribonuclease HI